VYVWGQCVSGGLFHEFLSRLLIWIRYRCHPLWSLEETVRTTEPQLPTRSITLWSSWRSVPCPQEEAESTASRWDHEKEL